MDMRAREARPDDLTHLLRLSYGTKGPADLLRSQVGEEWRWLWASGRFLATIVFDGERPAALAGAVLVTEELYTRLARSPRPYVNRRLAREPESGDRPFPESGRLMDGDATLLLDYVTWHERYDPEEAAVLRGFLMNAFLDLHGGYPIRRMALEVVGDANAELARRSGPTVVNDYAAWAKAYAVTPGARPYLLAIDREAALRTENHWYTRAFRNQPPRLGFSLAQRELLRLARHGLTDLQIADRLSVSTEAVKKRWESVYLVFGLRVPGLLKVEEGGRRGVEKRRLVLNHLAEALEELRP